MFGLIDRRASIDSAYIRSTRAADDAGAFAIKQVLEEFRVYDLVVLWSFYCIEVPCRN